MLPEQSRPEPAETRIASDAVLRARGVRAPARTDAGRTRPQRMITGTDQEETIDASILAGLTLPPTTPLQPLSSLEHGASHVGARDAEGKRRDDRIRPIEPVRADADRRRTLDPTQGKPTAGRVERSRPGADRWRPYGGIRVQAGDRRRLRDHRHAADVKAAAEGKPQQRQAEGGTVAPISGKGGGAGSLAAVHRKAVRLDQRQLQCGRLALGQRHALAGELLALLELMALRYGLIADRSTGIHSIGPSARSTRSAARYESGSSSAKKKRANSPLGRERSAIRSDSWIKSPMLTIIGREPAHLQPCNQLDTKPAKRCGRFSGGTGR